MSIRHFNVHHQGSDFIALKITEIYAIIWPKKKILKWGLLYALKTWKIAKLKMNSLHDSKKLIFIK